MSIKSNPKIVLVGNPNSGKSSLFNQLTGLNQKVGNFPGVTVDRKVGHCQLDEHARAEIIDLPGLYSLYPKSADEEIVIQSLLDPEHQDYPDVAVVVVDVSNLKRNLLLFTQVRDLGFPTVLALNMVDVATKGGLEVDLEVIKQSFGIQMVPINARTGKGIDDLKHLLGNPLMKECEPFYDMSTSADQVIEAVQNGHHFCNRYRAFQFAMHVDRIPSFQGDTRHKIIDAKYEHQFNEKALQTEDTLGRYKKIGEVIDHALHRRETTTVDWTKRLDSVLTHKVWGYAIFLGVLFLIFQGIFAWASWPMDLIDGVFGATASLLSGLLPSGMLSDLVTEGIIPGLGGILIFIPQIALLFAFIALLEESGYMSRVVFLMDKLMRPFGLNGKSVVPLISGWACAVPAIMAARNIENKRERLITIFVTPFMSCSARLPVYTILIGLVIPETYFLGIFGAQGLVMLGLYTLGVVAALGSAWFLKGRVKDKTRNFLIMEMPTYKWPRWRNVGMTILEKVKAFVLEAGRVILAISIVLWVLATYGPAEDMARAQTEWESQYADQPAISETPEAQAQLASLKLEQSYAGHLGKAIEPTISPLGYDWKIGIALLTSFAAREVFVGSLATLYSVGDSEDELGIRDRLRNEVVPETGEPRYTLALGLSLMVFYAFAMQCMSTLAVTYRETKSIFWPLAQLFFMTGIAYVSALVVYQLLV
ncbi:MAG TPA: ferrous iron transport protein B [Cytophagales bacterium]|nr:ferrous iron transport protein B [Cytophagales bacterium]HAP58488.1 ferrous iron transport protein B [Cytophagales bacterium]